MINFSDRETAELYSEYLKTIDFNSVDEDEDEEWEEDKGFRLFVESKNNNTEEQVTSQ